MSKKLFLVCSFNLFLLKFILSENIRQETNNSLLEDNSNENTGSESDVTFTIYNRNNLEGYHINENTTEKEITSVFILDLQTTFVTHGWLASENHSSVQDIKEAYTKTKDMNVITVGWSKISQNEYIKTTYRVKDVGDIVGRMISKLLHIGLISLEKIHLIGHSLGSHVMGIAGGTIINMGYGKVKRITGLDPAKPLYENISSADLRLDAEDAQFVDIIHTSTFGYIGTLGHADFFPNGGTSPQPGCASSGRIFCSHLKACDYFAESIYNESSFPAIQCGSYLEYELNKCLAKDTIYMGEPADASAKGSYYLQTSSSAPFGKGNNSTN